MGGYHLKNGFFGFSSTGGGAVLPRIWAVCVRQSCAVFAPLKNAWRNETCVPRRLESRRTRASPLLVCRHGILFRSLRGGSPETGGPAVRIQAVSIQPAHSPGLIFVRRLGASNLRFHGERRFGFSFSESPFHERAPLSSTASKINFSKLNFGRAWGGYGWQKCFDFSSHLQLS